MTNKSNSVSTPHSPDVPLAAAHASRFQCSQCDWKAPSDSRTWKCPRCGSPIELDRSGLTLDVKLLSGDGIWRYREWIGIDQPVRLGESRTPLIALPEAGHVHVKNESVLPTGSFKDRGAAVLVSWLAVAGASGIVLDSSGNSGAAHAAYAARAGLSCGLYAPEGTSPSKVAQSRAYGAQVFMVPGARAESSRAAQEAAETSSASYASHQWHPAFLAGTETIAFELWEQCEVLPSVVILPAGAGTLVLGLARGFERLRAAGLSRVTPRIIVVQAQTCAPIARALGRTEPDVPGRSAAEGIQVADPPRMEQVLAAIRQTGGAAVAVSEHDILLRHRELAGQGILTEPTGAAAIAGLAVARQQKLVAASDTIVAILTGSGLKTLDRWPTNG